MEKITRDNMISRLNNYIKNNKKSSELEKKIYEKSLLFNFEDDSKISDKYTNISYEVLYKLSDGVKLEDVIESVEGGLFGLEEKTFEKYKILQKEKDDFLDKPIDIGESIMECGKCKSKKTYSYTKQVRSADEGFTTFSFCFDCGNKWRVN